jgi:hypothetical protein
MGPLPPLVPRPLPHQPAARRRGTVPRQAPCPAVNCRWAAAHPGAALGAWRVSPGPGRAPSQTSARPLPQGRAKRPSRSAPTTTGSSLNPKRHPDTGRALCPFTRPAMPIRYGRTPLRGPLKSRARIGAGTRPTGSPAPRCNTPPRAPARRPRWRPPPRHSHRATGTLFLLHPGSPRSASPSPAPTAKPGTSQAADPLPLAGVTPRATASAGVGLPLCAAITSVLCKSWTRSAATCASASCFA